MIKYFLVLVLSTVYITLFAQAPKKTEIFIIGTLHESSKILTPEMLFRILEDIKPQIILQENDSKQIADYTKVINPNSNEQTSTLLFLEKYPKTLNLPFEFEGRNQYRKDHGMVPADNLTIRLMDSLYNNGLLDRASEIIYEKYRTANKALKAFSNTDIATFNSISFETLNRHRQHIQHLELPKISNSNEEFTRHFVTKPNGEKITYREGYQLWCNFWDLRNNTMALNIIKKANEYKGQRIVVLTGAQHKYYLKELLDKYYDGTYTITEYFK